MECPDKWFCPLQGKKRKNKMKKTAEKKGKI